MVWLLLPLAFGPLLFFLIVARTLVRDGRRKRIWRNWAARHGADTAAPSPTERGFCVSGIHAGLAFELDGISEEVGSSAPELFTRLCAPSTVPDGLVVAEKGSLLDLDAPLPRERVQTGDARFDSRFDVHARVPETAFRVLEPAVRRAMSDQRLAGMRIHTEDGRIELSWRGLELDPRTLDHALQILHVVARERGAVAAA